ncbi:MAG: MBL fold metallo-hydrolase [Chloroflexi bacterium]|nr:MBL fold metallo-hydrolase [Chloroflexota bacterium]
MAQLDKIVEGVYRISSTAGPGGFSFNQFLVKDEKSILIHTGAVQQFKAVADSIGSIVDIKQISYLFISHFESDECGALCNFLGLNPNLIPVCGAITARQLQGFGLHGSPQIVKPGDELSLGKRKLSFISYPSEMHLWEGLLTYDTTDKILFSSDLFVARGAGEAAIKKANRAEAMKIEARSIPSEEGRTKCQAALDQLDIQLVAVGHGPVLDLRP